MDHLLAGYDGSASSKAACRWAADEAARRAVELRIVGCVPTLPMGTDDSAFMSTASSRLQRDTRDQVEDLALMLARAHPTISINALAVPGRPRRRLVEEAASADLLVIGSTGARGTTGTYTGSVAHTVVRESPCPSIIVPREHAPSARPLVVVAIDGTGRSEAALDWAIDEADLLGARLEIVHAWRPLHGGHASPSANSRAQIDAARLLEAAIERARARSGTRVEGRLVDGNPATELAGLSRGADLAVIGSRSRHGVAFTVSGSVVDAMISHAASPIAVVREGQRRDRDSPTSRSRVATDRDLGHWRHGTVREMLTARTDQP
jgi:nucleotide-binding universal stress UspA family protein